MTNTNSNTKRILFLHGSSDLYGASKILLTTVVFLKNRNFDVYVVLSGKGPLVEALKKEQIEVIICKLGILRRKYFTLMGLFNRLQVLWIARKKLINLVHQYNIDILYSNTTGVLVGAFVANACHIKHIWHVHEIIEEPKLFSRFIGILINKFSNKVIVVSNEVKKHWEKYVNPDKLITIYNGLNYDEFLNYKSELREELKVKSNEILIGMIGRVNLWKGQKYFLQIAILLKKKYPNLKFVMAGDAYPGYEYLYNELDELIKDSDLESSIFNLGFRSDIPNIINGLDIFILPSIKPDPLPTVVLEAMASAKPVIATAHGGALEMVDNNNSGILIPWNDEQEAVNRVQKLIDSYDIRNKMGLNGRKRVLSHFSLEQFEKNMINTLNEL